MSTSCFSCVGHCDRILEHGSDLHVSVGRVRSSGEPLRLCSVLLPGLCWKVTPWSPHTVLLLGIACPFLSLGPSKKDVPTLLGVRGEEWHQMPVCGHKRLSLSLTVSGEEKAFHRSPPPSQHPYISVARLHPIHTEINTGEGNGNCCDWLRSIRTLLLGL